MELHRQLGVTRKTGYRMGMQIRQLMKGASFDSLLGGVYASRHQSLCQSICS
jgi:hypothetical protein